MIASKEPSSFINPRPSHSTSPEKTTHHRPRRRHLGTSTSPARRSAARLEHPESRTTDASNDTVKILAISPDPGIRLLLSSMLNSVPNYHCDALDSCELAVAECIKEPYQIVVVDDYEHTAQQALLCIGKIRARIPFGRVPRTLACTLRDHPVDQEVFFAAGVDACLSKPFSKRALLKRIDALIR